MSECDDAREAEMDQLMRTIPPMDATVAAALLREAKEVFDELGVVFFLRQGTCLGAVRDGAFIPWDDDIDLGSIYGMHGLTKRSVASVIEAFRARGFHVEAATYGGETWLGIMKRHIRIDWFCYRVHKGHVFHFPNVSIPVELFARLQEIVFAGERFLVPSPPEEYLRCKYGPNWATPKPESTEGGCWVRNVLRRPGESGIMVLSTGKPVPEKERPIDATTQSP